MGADLYAVKVWNEENAESYGGLHERLHTDLMAAPADPTGLWLSFIEAAKGLGHFRDAYNETCLAWQLGWDYTAAFLGELGEEHVMPPSAANELLERVLATELPPPEHLNMHPRDGFPTGNVVLALEAALGATVEPEQPTAREDRWRLLNAKRDWLIVFLAQAIREDSGVFCSV